MKTLDEYLLTVSAIEGSPIIIREYAVLGNAWVERVDYGYQFRRQGEAGFLRYDNGHKIHHKHREDHISEFERPPLLIDFLREVEDIITSGL